MTIDQASEASLLPLNPYINENNNAYDASVAVSMRHFRDSIVATIGQPALWKTMDEAASDLCKAVDAWHAGRDFTDYQLLQITLEELEAAAPLVPKHELSFIERGIRIISNMRKEYDEWKAGYATCETW